MRFVCVRPAVMVLVLLAMAACAPTRIKPDPGLLDAQAARENRLEGHDHWVIHARLGVSDGEHGGSGALVWTQRGQAYDFVLTAPVTGRSFQLAGDRQLATLKGLKQGSVSGPDAGMLLHDALGWQVPMSQLRYWVRGMRAPDSHAQLLFGDDRLPSLLLQDGWKVEYKDWFADSMPAVPRRVFAERDNYRVRVVINRWNIQ